MTTGNRHRKASTGFTGDTVSLAVLATLLVTAVVLVVRELRPEWAPRVDTRVRSGAHVTFVLIAPTAANDRRYQEQVKQAKQAVRLQAAAGGYLYSTVGISLDWAIENGPRILEKFGSFDETIVGRNWLNTGVKRYVHDLSGQAVVPQVVVIVEDVIVDTLPFRYTPPVEVRRAVGFSEMREWAAARFPVAF